MLLNKQISIWAFIKIIRFDIVAIGSYAVLIGLHDAYAFLPGISIPLSITATVGTAVSLILGFRTAQAYERWWEARIVWGAIVNDSRTLIRQLIQFIPESEGKLQAVRSFAHRQVLWCFALGESLRRSPFSSRVKEYLEAENITDKNIPNAILNRHSEALAGLNLTEFRQVQVDSTLARLCDAMGKCERIKTSVFPRSYSMLLHLLIYVFATMIPFGIDHNYIIVEVLLTAIIPLIFIAIERTAIIMQDPFENTPMDTPMTSLSTTIEINLKEMVGENDLPSPEQPKDYYMM